MSDDATTCPHCKRPIAARLIRSMAAVLNGSTTSKAKAAAARLNGQKGGRPSSRKLEKI